MLRYRVVHVGRKAQDPLLAAAQEYEQRLARYAKIETVLVRDSGLNAERDALLARLPAGEHVVALDERGLQLGTAELTERLRGFARRGSATVSFVIGGADGLHADVKARAQESWALSRLTLPHRLALVVLLEQLYRAHTILRGERYHRW